jgi:hypothetical protein
MIKISNKGIIVEGSLGIKGARLLWDLLNVVGNRFVLCARFPDEELKIEYSKDFEIVNDNILFFSFKEQDDFFEIVKILDYYCVNDFYITVNSLFSNIVKVSKNVFSDDDFAINEYLVEFPRTIHVEENKLFVDFKIFKEYVYQLERVAKRYKK